MPGIGTIKLYRTVLWRLSVLQFCRFSFCQVRYTRAKTTEAFDMLSHCRIADTAIS